MADDNSKVNIGLDEVQALFEKMGLEEPQRMDLMRLLEQTENMDEVAQVTLKGHLVLEEKLNQGIELFVFAPKHLPNLGFDAKVRLARSFSLDESENSMWNLVLAINELRNKLAHTLDPQKRVEKLENLRRVYTKECGVQLTKREASDEKALVTGAIVVSLGFIGQFVQEIDRFKYWVKAMDYVVNPHRHAKPDSSA